MSTVYPRHMMVHASEKEQCVAATLLNLRTSFEHDMYNVISLNTAHEIVAHDLRVSRYKGLKEFLICSELKFETIDND